MIKMYCKHRFQIQDAYNVFNVFEHAQNKRRCMAFIAIAQRAHSVAGDCTARTSVICIFNVVGTL